MRAWAWMAEVGVGFKRPELNSEPLAGSVKPYDKHVFLVWGLASDWPEDPFDGQHEGTLPVRLSKAIKAEKQIKSKAGLRLAAVSHIEQHGFRCSGAGFFGGGHQHL